MLLLFRLSFVALSVLQGYLLFELFPGNREIAMVIIWLPVIQILFSTENHYKYYSLILLVSSSSTAGKLASIRYISSLFLQYVLGFFAAIPLCLFFGVFSGLGIFLFPLIVVADKVFDELQRYAFFVSKNNLNWFVFNIVRKVVAIAALLAASLFPLCAYNIFVFIYSFLYASSAVAILLFYCRFSMSSYFRVGNLIASSLLASFLARGVRSIILNRVKVILFTLLAQQYSVAMRIVAPLFYISPEALPLNIQFASGIALLPDASITTSQRRKMPESIPDALVIASSAIGLALAILSSVFIVFLPSLLRIPSLPWSFLDFDLDSMPINLVYISIWSSILFLSSYFNALLEWRCDLDARFRCMAFSSLLLLVGIFPFLFARSSVCLSFAGFFCRPWAIIFILLSISLLVYVYFVSGAKSRLASS